MLLASVVALGACEQVLGIDKYQKCDANCGDGEAESSTGDAGDASADAFQLPDGVSEASSWPKWRVPNTTLEVQNGAPDASSPNTSVTDGGIVDNVTGLAWLVPIGSADTIDAAAAYCKSLAARLPTRIELATLLDSTRATPPYIVPALDNAVSTAKLQKGFLWSSSYVRPIDTQLEFWFMALASGDMQQSIAGTAGVLCVR